MLEINNIYVSLLIQIRQMESNKNENTA